MLFTILLILYFVLFAVLSWRRLDWAIYLIIFVLPSYLIRFEVLGIPTTVLELMILVLFLIWLIKKLPVTHYPLRITQKTLIWPITLFLLAATISVFTAPELRPAAGIWKAYFLEPILFLIVLVDTIKTKEQFNRVIWAIGLSLLIPGLLAIYQKFTGAFILNEFWRAEETRRVTSVYGFPNAVGLYFAPITILLAGWLVARLKSVKQMVSRANLGLLALLVIGLLSIAFAVSKGAALAVFVGITFYALFWRGKRLFFTGVVLGALIVSLFTPQLRSLAGTSTVPGGGSLEVRVEQWGETIELLKTRPILGAGLSGFQTAVAPFHQKDYIEIFMYPHQIVLNFWSEIGLLGLLAFIWLVVLFYRMGFQSLTPNTYNLIPVMAAMTALLAHGLVDVPYFKNDLAFLFWILIGLVMILAQKNTSDTSVK